MSNRFEIIGSEAEHERARKLLRSGGFGREWLCNLWVGERDERLEIWAAKVLPKIWAWLELNSDKPEKMDEAVAGLLEWQKITDTAIVTTVPGVRIYGELCACVPGMQIIPGVKTNDVLRDHVGPRFDDVDGWKKIGKELAAMAEATGSKIVVLEGESAVERYRLGNETINWALFRKCLAQLPKDLTIGWYPAMTGGDDDEQDRMGSLSDEVADSLCNAVLLDHQSRGGPRGLTYSWSIKGREKLDEIVRRVPGTSILRMMYFYGPKESYWQDDQIFEALGSVGDGRVIIYPGAERWVKAAKLFVAALGTLPAAELKT